MAGGDSFTMLENLLKVSQFRQKVLSSNIANADTPGYRSKDIADFKNLLSGESNKLQIATTNPMHITPKTDIPDVSHVKVQEIEPWADSNNVEMDIEVSKMTENSLMYETGVRLITDKINKFKQAVQGR